MLGELGSRGVIVMNLQASYDANEAPNRLERRFGAEGV